MHDRRRAVRLQCELVSPRLLRGQNVFALRIPVGIPVRYWRRCLRRVHLGQRLLGGLLFLRRSRVCRVLQRIDVRSAVERVERLVWGERRWVRGVRDRA